MSRYKTLRELNFLNSAILNVGVLGGTFNPAHIGHLSISRSALTVFDYVIWLVANQNPFKKNSGSIFKRAIDAARFASHPKIIVSTAEYDLKNYNSYDSLFHLIRRFPTITFSWIMGIDHVSNFRKWHRYQDLIRICNILIFDRPCPQRLMNISSLVPSNLDNIMLKRERLYNYSSTQIRNSLHLS